MPLAIGSAVPEDEAEVVDVWRACSLLASHNAPAADLHPRQGLGHMGAECGPFA